MAKLDTGRLIRETQKLVAESKGLHDWSRRAKQESDHLAKAIVVSVSTSRRMRHACRTRRNRLLAVSDTDTQSQK